MLMLENGETYTVAGGYLDIGIVDTMKDLIVNCIGAVVFSVIGYFYIVGRNKGIFASKFIPQMKTKEEIELTEAEIRETKEKLIRKRIEKKKRYEEKKTQKKSTYKNK